MATVKKGTLTRALVWWKHLRPYNKRDFWGRERRASRREILDQLAREQDGPEACSCVEEEIQREYERVRGRHAEDI